MNVITKRTNIIYDKSKNLAYDMYFANNEKQALIVDIHGGGWFQGDKTKDEDIAEIFAKSIR